MIQKPRGTKDIYGNDEKIYKFIFETFEQIANNYNFQRIITPVFEYYELFKDTNGESSDIVSKEIYKFNDFGNRLLALKPEGTAPVGRAIVENKLFQEKKYNKLYYMDSMFRYEKPQKGRLRQFYQIGIELTNELNKNSILESIVLASNFLKNLNINDYTLHINNLGFDQDRKRYVDELKKYLLKHKDKLSLESQKRIEINPLRILDDKNDSQLDVIKNAPKINQFWSQESKNEFEEILFLLDKLKIKYQIDYSLVRGLDYYSNTVFEFVSFSPHLGAKATLIGGGCYLDLMDSKSNKINGVGFGCGVERLFEIIKATNQIKTKQDIDIYFGIEDDKQYKNIIPIIYQLRNKNLAIEFNYVALKWKKIFLNAKYYDSKMVVFQELEQINSDFWTIKMDDQRIKCNIEDLINKCLYLIKKEGNDEENV